jgi:hypothetical protein
MFHRIMPVVFFFCALSLTSQMALHGQGLSSTPAQQRGDTLYVTKAMIDKGFSLDSVLFRYHAGDDMAWSKSEYDDSAWQSMRNDTAGRQLTRDGIGWMRIRIRFDSTISQNTIISLLGLSQK